MKHSTMKRCRRALLVLFLHQRVTLVTLKVKLHFLFFLTLHYSRGTITTSTIKQQFYLFSVALP